MGPSTSRGQLSPPDAGERRLLLGISRSGKVPTPASHNVTTTRETSTPKASFTQSTTLQKRTLLFKIQRESSDPAQNTKCILTLTDAQEAG